MEKDITLKRYKYKHCEECQYRELTCAHDCNYFTIMLYADPMAKSHQRGCSMEECTHWQDPPVNKKFLFDNAKHNEEQKDERRQREKQMRTLYDDGLNDKQIGEVVGVSKGTVRSWRRRFGLEANAENGRPTEKAMEKAKAKAEARKKAEAKKPLTLEEMEERDKRRRERANERKRRYYAEGRTTAAKKVEANREAREEKKRILRQLHEDGFSDYRIAEIMGENRSKIFRWRTEMGLEANNPKGGGEKCD